MFKYVFITLLLKRTILFKQLVAFELRLNMFVGIGVECLAMEKNYVTGMGWVG